MKSNHPDSNPGILGTGSHIVRGVNQMGPLVYSPNRVVFSSNDGELFWEIFFLPKTLRGPYRIPPSPPPPFLPPEAHSKRRLPSSDPCACARGVVSVACT